MINWKVRFKNPQFLILLAVSVFAPILAYNGISEKDLTTWGSVIDLIVSAIKNPYVLMLVFTNVYASIIDPVSKGFGDSERAKELEEPSE